MDATYFWRKYCYVIFRAWFPNENKWKNLLWYKEKYETNLVYKRWFEFLKEKWWIIQAIVCDWRKWLLWWFWPIPVQMCLYHMKQIIVRYLTKKPKLEQNKKLIEISRFIWDLEKEQIEKLLTKWNKENKEWLWERNKKWEYKHIKTRKAYRSIKSKLNYCYTFKEYKELLIPSTNNSLEWINSHLKTKLKIHRWLKENKKDTFTCYYLYNS